MNNSTRKKNDLNQQSVQGIIFPADEKTSLVRPMQATKEDYAAVARCYNSFKDSDSWPGGFGGSLVFTGDFIEDRFQALDLSSRFIVLAPDDDKKIVGVSFCCKSWNLPDAWYVQLLGVDPAYQGQKLGKALLLHSTKFAMTKNCRFISLHTWGGNLKAMPLYKRQGYKWRPNTSCYLENYIPQIINYPLFRDLFSNYSWYDAFQAVITQEPDKEFDQEMAIYEYFFRFDDQTSLRVWVDRTIGRISGFHKITPSENLLLKFSTPKSEGFTGIEEFPVSLQLANNGSQSLEFSIDFGATDQFVVSGTLKHSLRLQPGESKEFSLTASLQPETAELDLQANPLQYSDHELFCSVTIAGQSIPLRVGKVPLAPYKIQIPFSYLPLKPNTSQSLPLEIVNNLGKEQSVTVELLPGNHIQFTKSTISTAISLYDSLLELPIVVADTATTVDTVTCVVRTVDGKEQARKTLSVPIFKNNSLVTYERNHEQIIENKYVRVAYYQKPQPGDNELFITDKKFGLQVNGLAMILGYPVDDDGSEFFSKQLSHEVIKDDCGWWLVSSALSDEKPGIKVSRKLFIPFDDAPLSLHYELENQSSTKVTDLAVHIGCYWWPNQHVVKRQIAPYKEGIGYFELYEFNANLGKDPALLAEGWSATSYLSGTIGFLFDHKKLDVFYHGRRFPKIEYRSPDLAEGDQFISPKTHICFTSNWQKVRSLWREIYHHGSSNLYEFYLLPTPLKKFGLQSSDSSTAITSSLLLDRKQKDFLVAISAFKEATFKGNMSLSFEKLSTSPKKLALSGEGLPIWRGKFSLSPTTEQTIVGQLHLDAQTRQYSSALALGFYDSSKEVLIESKTEGKNSFQEVNNGFLVFRGNKDHNGRLFYLSIAGSDNYLNTTYPEPKPFLWFSKFFGGIGPTVFSGAESERESYCDVSFESYKASSGLWKGIGFKSKVLDYSKTIKGLQIASEYLTLPLSPFILVRQKITNHSLVPREIEINMNTNLKTSQTSDDRYYISAKEGGIAEFRMQDFQSAAGIESKRQSQWVAFKQANNDYYIGCVLASEGLYASSYAYAPNLSFMRIGTYVSKLRILPGETKIYSTLVLVSKDLRCFEPFASNNLKDLL